MNMSNLMTHVTIALTPTYSNALPLSVNGLGVETADTVCRCRDRFVLFKLDLFCIVVCVFIVKVCLSQTLVTLYYTHAQLHMRTLHVFTQLCIFSSIDAHLSVYCEVFLLLLKCADSTWIVKSFADLWLVCFASVSVPSLLAIGPGNVVIPKL